MKLGEVLHIFRIVNNKKVKDVAKELQCSNSFIMEFEADGKKLNSEMLKKLAKVYKVTPSQIFYIQEMSCANNWSFQKTLYEVLTQWLKNNDPEWLKSRMN
jgi:transcriptional regulator with XRE-family HTH domain